MTVLCDRCGRGYFVGRALGTPFALLRLLCPHCGNMLWSTVPAQAAHAEPLRKEPQESKFPRGIS